jgi:twitching motility protein PilT
MDSFLRLVVDQGASDLHFHAGNVPAVRHDGDLMRLPFRQLSETEARRFILEILTPEQREVFEASQDLDFIYEVSGVGRFRANVFLQQHGMSAVFRVVPYRVPTLDELRLPDTLEELAQLNNGLVLITGPTGSGKTTTLAAIVREINSSQHRHVITIEDPIEFVHAPDKSVITQRQVGEHTGSFEDALRSALRESPDVLVVGELRDYETIRLALQAAETGALVFGSLHTSSSVKAVDRIIDALPEELREQTRGVLSVLLRGVVAQRLCKLLSGEGRIAVVEVLLQTWAVSNLIRENKIYQIEGYLQSANFEKTGMQSLDACIYNHVRDNLISLEEGLKVAAYPDQLRQRCADLPEE